jgi:hypothetical protein
MAIWATIVGNISTIRANVNSQMTASRNAPQPPLWMAQEMHPFDALAQKDMAFLLML